MTPGVVGGPPGDGDGQRARRRIRSEGVPAWTVVSAVIAVMLLGVLAVATVLLILYVF
ncbi:MAG TPA: hypothetical protein VKD67_12040 [Acidimicrobiales bacterium]|nr:hypothetical protein [Acidimicrobiales bacterium]